MAGYKREVVIHATPAAVVAFVLDPKNAPAVIEGVTEMIKLDDGPVRVGTRFRETRMMQGKLHTAEMEVVAFDPDAGYTIRSDVEGIEVTYRYDVRPHDQGSHVALRCDVKGRGIKKLLTPIVAAIMAKMDGDHLQRLQTAMKSG